MAFRYYTVRSAKNLFINGSVRNLFDGDVEVVAQGEPGNIKRFEAFLRAGPPSAVVDRVIKEELDYNEVFSDFEIIY